MPIKCPYCDKYYADGSAYYYKHLSTVHGRYGTTGGAASVTYNTTYNNIVTTNNVIYYHINQYFDDLNGVLAYTLENKYETEDQVCTYLQKWASDKDTDGNPQFKALVLRALTADADLKGLTDEEKEMVHAIKCIISELKLS